MIRSLDDARTKLPHLGFAIFAMEPGGVVTLEVYADGNVFPFVAPTEREAWEIAYPEPPAPDEPEPDIFD